jgi:hypothetical protein
MSSCTRPIQQLCSLSMDRAVAPPNHCALAPYGFIAGVQRLGCAQWLVPLFGINFEATSKNREIGGALALGGRCFMNIFNNQMEVGVRGRRFIEEDTKLGRNVQWGVIFLFRAVK